MLKLGITGGIGTGKSIVSMIITKMGYPVFNSDLEAHSILHTDKIVHEFLKKNFGDGVFENNIPNRAKIASEVFQHPEKLRALNNLIHPLVKQQFLTWSATQKSDLVFKEAAILIESGSYKELDKIILVTSPLPLRIERIMKRDKTDEGTIQSRINNQFSEEEKLEFAHFIIINDENHALIPQIQAILAELKKAC